MKFSFLNLI